MWPRSNRGIVLGVLFVVSLAAGTLAAWAAPGDDKKSPSAAQAKVTATRFEFEVIESFDSKYLGDTAGHHGRNGGLAARPHVYLGDPVYRDQLVVGYVTSVKWDRVNAGLDVEFDPAPLRHVSLGDVVWIRIDEHAPLAEHEVAP